MAVKFTDRPWMRSDGGRPEGQGFDRDCVARAVTEVLWRVDHEKVRSAETMTEAYLMIARELYERNTTYALGQGRRAGRFGKTGIFQKVWNRYLEELGFTYTDDMSSFKKQHRLTPAIVHKSRHAAATVDGAFWDLTDTRTSHYNYAYMWDRFADRPPADELTLF